MLKIIIPSILLLNIIACTVPPKPVYRLIPDAEKTAWLYGQEFVHLDNDSFDVALAYDRIWTNNYVFDIEIANKSENTFLISPDSFYFKPLYSKEKMDKTPVLSRVGFVDSSVALDPELKILQMDLKQSSMDASYETNERFLVGLSILDLVFDIATYNNSKTDAEITLDEIGNLELESEYIENELEHQSETRNINWVRDQWRDEALRKTSLKPGYSIYGKIYFPIKYLNENDIRYSENLLFCFPLRETLFTQIFNIKKYLVGVNKKEKRKKWK